MRKDCPHCNGTGTVEWKHHPVFLPEYMGKYADCPHCNGTGKVHE